MKALKLDHALAMLVLEGKKTSTWRLYDDKDISVNDDVELIDKVDPNDPATWRPIGVAHINEVIQKRIADITVADSGGHGAFSSTQALVQEFRKYYGDRVSPRTPIKIIRFAFTVKKNRLAKVEAKNTSKLTEVKLFADGGSRGNPGPSASGFVIMDMNEHVVARQGTYLGITTNNQAEYQALKFAFEEAKRMKVQVVHVYMDSLLVINQMLGTFKVKNRDLWPIHDAIRSLAASFRHVTYTQVPREFNKLADAAVNEALDAAHGTAVVNKSGRMV